MALSHRQPLPLMVSCLQARPLMQIKSTIRVVEALPLILVVDLGLVELEAEREMQEQLLLTFCRLVVFLLQLTCVFL